jgi:hypothetical protein
VFRAAGFLQAIGAEPSLCVSERQADE